MAMPQRRDATRRASVDSRYAPLLPPALRQPTRRYAAAFDADFFYAVC